jgi:hypothetical protein
MILDGVLADRSVTWLGSEREKRCYFKRQLGDHLRDDEYPLLVFGTRPNVTVRHFSDKLAQGIRLASGLAMSELGALPRRRRPRQGLP